MTALGKSGIPIVDGGCADEAHCLRLLLAGGALVVRNAARRTAVASVDAQLSDVFEATPFSEGNFYGSRTVRFGRLLARSEAMRDIMTNPLVQGVAVSTIARWHRSCSLSFAQAIAIYPGSAVQVPHRDGEMWPVPPSDAEHLVSVVWPLTNFDASNGATMVWPRSHCAGEGDAANFPPEQIKIEPGDALLFLGSTRHAGGANRSAAVRRGVVGGYAASWLVPAENPALAYPSDVARAFAPNWQRWPATGATSLISTTMTADARPSCSLILARGLERLTSSCLNK